MSTDEHTTPQKKSRTRRCYGCILSFLNDSSPWNDPIQAEKEKQYLLVKGRHGGVWSFPKGHAKREEEPLATARRETEEETGLTFPDQQPVRHQRLKNVVYFHFECTPIHYHTTLQPTDTFEVEETRWTTLQEMDLLSLNSGVREFLEKKKKHLGF